MKKLIKLNSIIAIIAVVFLASCTKNEVTKVTISDSSLTLYVGQIDSLFADADYTGDIVPSVTWSSSNPAVVSIKGGEIEALKTGTATITATAGDKTATCKVTVDNKIKATFNSGALIYYGDDYATNLSNNYQLYLMNGNDTLVLEFNTELTVTDNLPTGTYLMVDFDGIFSPNTLVAADLQSGYGSWFYNKAMLAPILGGSASVINISNAYTIQYELADYYGNLLTGTYNGTLDFYNATQPATISAAKISKKNLSKRMMLKK